MIIHSKVKVCMFGKTEENIMVNGLIARCMVMESIPGRMDANIVDTMLMIKNMDMVYINGQMEKHMMVNGKMESSMEKVSILILLENKKGGFGIMEKE